MNIIEEKALVGTLDYTGLDGDDWACLLRKQPQFSHHCDWSKLGGYDWSYLLRKQPQLAIYCTQYKVGNECGVGNRTIWIDIRDPQIIHIGY